MKIIYFILIIITLNACNLKKVEKHHGVKFLDRKQGQLIVNKSNKNDIIELLGYPSTKSVFDNDVWIYIERVKDHSSIVRFGGEQIVINHVLLLEINNMGLLANKEFSDISDMEKIQLTKDTTETQFKKDTFVFNFLSSMRQKVNDPLGKRKR
jgi:outer membrane protein assembly factor BamE (lipoprotein component of BamABCDE complex)|tara:strand:- start:233 stop:691 length:459 start_codon:yes stop_codon:yes gene_type:complete